MRAPGRAGPLHELPFRKGGDGDELVLEVETVGVLGVRRPPEVVRLEERARDVLVHGFGARLPREDAARRRRAEPREEPRARAVAPAAPRVLVVVGDLAAARRARVRQPRGRARVRAVLEAPRRRHEPQREVVAEREDFRARVLRLAAPVDAVRRQPGLDLAHVWWCCCFGRRRRRLPGRRRRRQRAAARDAMRRLQRRACADETYACTHRRRRALVAERHRRRLPQATT